VLKKKWRKARRPTPKKRLVTKGNKDQKKNGVKQKNKKGGKGIPEKKKASNPGITYGKKKRGKNF